MLAVCPLERIELAHEWRVQRIETPLDRRDSGGLLSGEGKILGVRDDDVDAVRQAQFQRWADLFHRGIVATRRSTDAHALAGRPLRAGQSTPADREEYRSNAVGSSDASHDHWM